MGQFIQLHLGEMVRWVNIYQIAALEEAEALTIIYLIHNPGIHIACDEAIGDVMQLIQDAEDDIVGLEESNAVH